MTARRTSKNLERYSAEALGIERVSINAIGRKIADVQGFVEFVDEPVELVGECKLRTSISSLFDDAIEQAAENITTDNQVPVAIVKRKGDRFDESLVVFKLSDFKKLIKEKP